jgi:hypothetical protein
MFSIIKTVYFRRIYGIFLILFSQALKILNPYCLDYFDQQSNPWGSIPLGPGFGTQTFLLTVPDNQGMVKICYYFLTPSTSRSVAEIVLRRKDRSALHNRDIDQNLDGILVSMIRSEKKCFKNVKF